MTLSQSTMEERRELRRMPRGERCPECGSVRWYLQDGLRFCSRGHQIEGFIQFDVGEDEDSGRLGAVTRREREIRSSEKRQLSGQEGKSLYLEAVQLLLRNQALWLIHDKGYREELETVIRDLWDLRIRGSSALATTDDDAAEGQLEMFSSQSLPEENKAAWKSRARAQIWDPERGADWPMPTLPETLGLCYLASLLLRIPTRLGELLHWANSGNIPYKTAYHDLPREMQDRLPSAYVKAFKLPLRSSLQGGIFYRTVMDLVLSYHLNYGIVFPEMSSVSLLVQYAKLLALPIESIVATKRLSASLGYRFQFPANNSKILPLDHPEIRLVALLILATKLCFPFKGNQPSTDGLGTAYIPHFDWETWKQGLVQHPEEEELSNKAAQFEAVTPNQVVQMNDEELDAYFAHIAGLVDNRNENPITHFFPTESSPAPAPPVPEASEDEVDERASRLLKQTLEPPRGLGTIKVEGPSDGIMYEAFRSVQDLSETAAAFYKAIGTVHALSITA
ncbi:RNA polymerase I-specific transcription initiation factor rrn7 [Tolypocladium ophioglossoides CBS 100239]|uniref:RNA polymerase I-specific transcription initiation factor rrn7 n=1 Tax=Tolypocladium ophioglossoides (strain CBS 100239) TaxID=1163406 RepID=A0A0L0N934_TOLOC|nr:RNA polymerase I-specific transcription initiation factor rrn7 [Tolypocladium ophioglossoides CBS 100239]